MKKFILLIRGRALESLGEIERAKSVYTELKGTEFENIGVEKIGEYEAREKMERELQERIAQLYQPHEFKPSGHPWLVIIVINLIFIAIIIFLLYHRNKK